MPAWADHARAVLWGGLISIAGLCAASAQEADLHSAAAFRVCADPAAAPMSSQDGTGFENHIAELLAQKLNRPLEYTWFPMGPGFIRKTLRAGVCDVVIGFAQGDEIVQNTNHYYTSAFGLVTRKDGKLAKVTALSDPDLKGSALGVVAGTAPADHMARNGLLSNIHSFPLVVDRRVLNPIGDMIAQVKDGKLDAAAVWGPLAGPVIKDDPTLQFTPLLAEEGQPRMYYRITMGVRVGENDWKRELNSQIRRNQAEIDQILRNAGVPILDDYGKGPK